MTHPSASLPMFALGARKGISVSACDWRTANGICEHWHYLAGAPAGESVYHLFHTGYRLDGVICYQDDSGLPPNNKRYWQGIFGGRAVQLTRVALRPQSERELQTSVYVALSISVLKGLRKYAGCFSYSDPRHHEGVLYKACNFTFVAVGVTSSTLIKDGERKHGRHTDKAGRDKLRQQGWQDDYLPGKLRWGLGLTKAGRRSLRAHMEAKPIVASRSKDSPLMRG